MTQMTKIHDDDDDEENNEDDEVSICNKKECRQ